MIEAPHPNQMALLPQSTGSSSSNSENLSEADCYSAQMLTDKSVLKKRDLEFPRHDVTVVRRIDCIGLSSFYEAKSSRKDVSSDGDRNFLMKATVASTREQARRAEAEVRILRRLPDHHNVLKLLDSGCSATETSPENHKRDDDVLLEVQRVYCLLFKDCPSRTVRDVMSKHRAKLDRRIENSGWLDIETALGIFRQMAAAVAVLHDGHRAEGRTPVVHLDIRPEHFAAFKTSRDGAKGCKYIVKLTGAGCAVDQYMPLYDVADRMKAARLIDSATSPRYRAPEMINLQLTDELDDSADIWGLGCCLYGILFLKDCFEKDSRLNILQGKYEIPSGHPYSNDVLDLLARMLTVEPMKRPDIHDVIKCVDALASGKSLPPRQYKRVRVSTNDGLPLTPESFAQHHADFAGKVTIGVSRRHSASAASSQRSRSQCDCTLSTWDLESDMSTSADTEWLEFAPDDMSGSCLRRFSESASSTAGSMYSPTTPRSGSDVPKASEETSTVDSSSQRSRRSSMSHWTYGIIDRMSSRSLIFIDGESSGDDDTFDGSRLSSARPKVPSLRELGGSQVQSVSHDTHMTNTPPSPTDISKDLPQDDSPSPRLTQKRRPSMEKQGIRETSPTGSKSRNKHRTVRTKFGSPSTSTRKKSVEQQPMFHTNFPPTDAFFGDHSRGIAASHNNRRSLPVPVLPPPSPRNAIKNRPKSSKHRSRSNHKDSR